MTKLSKLIESCWCAEEIELPGSAVADAFSKNMKYSCLDCLKLTSAIPKKDVKYLGNIQFSKIVLSEAEKNYKVQGKVLCTKNEKTVVASLYGSSVIKFPKKCQTIYSSALANCEDTKIVFHKKIKKIKMVDTRNTRRYNEVRRNVKLDLKKCKLKGSEIDKVLWLTDNKYEKNR